ncbi:MAG TPA: hypothetical protein VE173_10275, partial [Longimicrobiales bacterium]|nr:hypothetical protein [Longimicrobiales bacterium]
VAEAMYGMIAEYQGRKKFKALDLQKAMRQQFGSEADRSVCKDAIRQLIDSGRCVYTYFGGSYIEVPHEEGAASG